MDENKIPEKNERNYSKHIVLISFSAMVIVSIIIAVIMVNNYQKDDSKNRYQLTKIYKKVKDEKYTFSYPSGHIVYTEHCARCHGKSGQGVTPVRGLAKSTTVNGHYEKPLKILLNGIETRDGVMPGFRHLDHMELTHVLNYIRKSFGNDASIVHPVEIVKGKIDTIEQKTPYKPGDL